MWGVNRITGVYTRIGVTKQNPIGKKWKGFPKKKLVSVSVGPGTLYGIDTKSKPSTSVASVLAGPKALPKKPAGMY